MELTQDDLKVLYDRVIQYSIARWANEPDYIIIDYDGQLKLRFDSYHDNDYETRYIDMENLTDDLDALVAERKEKEQIEREQKEKEQLARQIQNEKYAKQQRFEQYLKYKKEFEGHSVVKAS